MTAQAQPLPQTLAMPTTAVRRESRKKLTLGRQLLLQLICLAIALTVLFPIAWIVAMSLDPRDTAKPDTLFPPGATLDAYTKVIAQPTLNPISFARLAVNSIFIAVVISAMTVVLGTLAAYAFSRMKFRGREVLMISVLAVLMLPAIATIAPLFVTMNRVVIGSFNLRASLIGVAIAVTATQLPFAIWNIKGYFDTIPHDLEEAAYVDGATRLRTFLSVVIPLSTPVLAVTAFFGFIAGWTEFYFSWMFLAGNIDQWTLAMTLNGMVGQYAANTPWSQFAAFSILVALPVSVVYLFFQRYIVSGLTIGGVKG